MIDKHILLLYEKWCYVHVQDASKKKKTELYGNVQIIFEKDKSNLSRYVLCIYLV